MTPLQPESDQPLEPQTFAPLRPGRWVERLMQYRYAVVIALVLLFVFGQKAMAQEFKSAADCVVGKRVVTREKQAGTIVKADGSSCHVKLDATGKTDYNIFWMLRAEGASGKPGQANPAAAASASSGSLPLGKYPCYMLAGTVLNYAFIDIHIESSSRYRDSKGQSGSYKIGTDNKITFTGPLASANGKLLSGSRIGLNMNGGSFYNTTCSKKA
ncbi:MAG: hypothetical protein WBK51_15190 [Polaromonas sp.]